MPIVKQLFKISNPPFPSSPVKRRCPICHRFGAHKHGFYERYRPGSFTISDGGFVFVPRFLCFSCHKTFSCLPWFFVRRLGAVLSCLLGVALSCLSKGALVKIHQISRATVGRWKKHGKKLLDALPNALSEMNTSWTRLSFDLSRLQYPGLLRKNLPTIPGVSH